MYIRALYTFVTIAWDLRLEFIHASADATLSLNVKSYWILFILCCLFLFPYAVHYTVRAMYLVSMFKDISGSLCYMQQYSTQLAKQLYFPMVQRNFRDKVTQLNSP